MHLTCNTMPAFVSLVVPWVFGVDVALMAGYNLVATRLGGSTYSLDPPRLVFLALILTISAVPGWLYRDTARRLGHTVRAHFRRTRLTRRANRWTQLD